MTVNVRRKVEIIERQIDKTSRGSEARRFFVELLMRYRTYHPVRGVA